MRDLSELSSPRAAASRAYYVANRDALLAYKKATWPRDKAAHAERKKQYRQKNKPHASAKHAEYRAANGEKLRQKNAKWRAANRDRLLHHSHSTLEREAQNLFRQARRRALGKGVPFTLTMEWIRARLLIGRCQVSGLPFDNARSAQTGNVKRPFAASIDRIEAAPGYVESNCRMVCVVLNMAMNSWGLPAVQKLAEALVANHK